MRLPTVAADPAWSLILDRIRQDRVRRRRRTPYTLTAEVITLDMDMAVLLAQAMHLRKKNLRKADAQSVLLPVADRKNQVKPVGHTALTKKENPAPQVLPKENGQSDHYGRKEANCVEDAPKAG